MCWIHQTGVLVIISLLSWASCRCMPVLVCVLYLTVESEDPVTMTLSSYCRHNTEPVCPVRIFRHSRLCLSQIYEKQTEVEGMEWNEGHTGRQQQRKRENKRSAKGNKCGSRWEHPILSAVFLPHLASLFWTFRSSLRHPPQHARTHARLPSICAARLQKFIPMPLCQLLQGNLGLLLKTHVP